MYWKGGNRNTRTNITYRSWNKMKQRCTNPNNDRFAKYGGRGITLCDRWQDYDNFLADMGERPSVKHCLCRQDHDKGYQPGNVEWGTKEENNRENAIRNRAWERSPDWQRRAV